MKKKCKNYWINKQVLMDVRDRRLYVRGRRGAYWGELKDAKTQKGTMNKAFLAEMRCHGVKAVVRRKSGYPPELYLVPIKGRKVKYPF